IRTVNRRTTRWFRRYCAVKHKTKYYIRVSLFVVCCQRPRLMRNKENSLLHKHTHTLALSLSLSLSHTHTHTRTHTHKRTHTHTHSLIVILTCINIHTCTHIDTHIHTPTQCRHDINIITLMRYLPKYP